MKEYRLYLQTFLIGKDKKSLTVTKDAKKKQLAKMSLFESNESFNVLLALDIMRS